MTEFTFIPVPPTDIELEAEYFLPDSAESPKIAVVLCHPHPLMGGSMHDVVVTAIFRELSVCGLPVLRFNFRGAGQSGGVHDNGKGEIDDVNAVIASFKEISGALGIFVAGYSFGAAMGCVAAAENPGVLGYAAVAMPFRLFPKHARRIDCSKPKLFVTGTRDNFTELEVFHKMVGSLSDPVETFEIKGADHFFSIGSRDVGKKVADFCLAWFGEKETENLE